MTQPLAKQSRQSGRLSRLLWGGPGALALLLIGAACFFGLNQVKRRAAEIAYDTMPGISYAVDANASAGQAFNCTMMLLLSHSDERSAALRLQLAALNQKSADAFAAYKAAIFQAADRVNFDRCMWQRAEYLRIREVVLSLLQNGRRSEATARTESELLPAYQRYSESAVKLFNYNVQQAAVRGKTIAWACVLARWAVAAILVLVFTLGFWRGLFK